MRHEDSHLVFSPWCSVFWFGRCFYFHRHRVAAHMNTVAGDEVSTLPEQAAAPSARTPGFPCQKCVFHPMDLRCENIAERCTDHHDRHEISKIVAHCLLRRFRLIILQIIGGLRHFTAGAEQVTQRFLESFGRQMRWPGLPWRHAWRDRERISVERFERDA